MEGAHVLFPYNVVGVDQSLLLALVLVSSVSINVFLKRNFSKMHSTLLPLTRRLPLTRE